MIWAIAYGVLVICTLLLNGCATKMAVVGQNGYCLTDYRTQTRYCEYDSYRACKNDLRDGSMCGKQ